MTADPVRSESVVNTALLPADAELLREIAEKFHSEPTDYYPRLRALAAVLERITRREIDRLFMLHIAIDAALSGEEARAVHEAFDEFLGKMRALVPASPAPAESR